MTSAQRGSAVVEFCAVAGAFAAIVAALLVGAYALVARAELEYHAEQGLYCLAERSPEFWCRRRLIRTLAATLPYGRVTRASLARDGRKWKVDLEWKLSPFRNFDPITFTIDKTLTLRKIVGKTDLH